MTIFSRQHTRIASRAFVAAALMCAATNTRAGDDDSAPKEVETVATATERWESSESDVLRHSVAEDLTGGVRVEDIVEPTAEYHFASFGKGDPFSPPPEQPKGSSSMIFRPADDAARLSSAATREEVLKSKLQRYKLDELKIVGMWRAEGESRKALILTPEGQGVTVQENDPITPGGKIARIEKDRLVVRMYSIDIDGTQKSRDEFLAFTKGREAEDTGKIVMRPGKEAEFISDRRPLPETPAAGLPSLNPPLPSNPMNGSMAPPTMPATSRDGAPPPPAAIPSSSKASGPADSAGVYAPNLPPVVAH